MIMLKIRLLLISLTCALAIGLLSGFAASDEADDGATQSSESAHRLYTFSWLFTDDDAMSPRGGTTNGPPVQLHREASDAWKALREDGLPKLERDRRAILAMAGPYRTTFDFIETAGFTPDYEPARPYRSWGTEYVYVVADEPRFISLQHIIVMFFLDEHGETQGPAVVKHWRQDWTYEDRSIHEFIGFNTWEERELSAEAAAGAWSQAVYQVDDSPRYEASGRWEHHGNYSSWISGHTLRPLPRREFSVRDDYQALAGTNRHTITPTGWIHEENNLKLVLEAPGELREELPYLAREAGLNRYERIVDHDFSAGDDYWSRSQPFWADVRTAWERIKDEHPRFELLPRVDDRSLFEVMFEYADTIDAAQGYDASEGQAFIDDVLDGRVQSK